MDLREYEKTKFKIAELLRAISEFIPKERSDWRQRLQGLFVRLAEDRFNLAVVGRYSRGKTTLMNAILGTDRLPTGLAPLTSVVVAVSYGSSERALLKYDSRILDKEISIDALPQHITQQGNPGNIQRIKTAEIQLPSEFLRSGFYFVDTPGLGSAVDENTLTTTTFLPEADAFILVTSYDSPLSAEEFDFIRNARSSRRRLFVVINKQDTVPEQMRGEVIIFVREQIKKVWGPDLPAIFSVSSTDAIAAKLADDKERLARSGISKLETDLVAFLLFDKTSAFLRGMCDRAEELLQALPRLSEIEHLRARVAVLRNDLRSEPRLKTMQTEQPQAGGSTPFSDLHRVPPCEICAAIAEQIWEFLRQYQYDLASNPAAQDHFAGLGGFCPFHAWEYEAIASPNGICGGHAPLLHRIARRLHDAAMTESNSISSSIRRLLTTEQRCPLCEVRFESERTAIANIAAELGKDGPRAVNELSAICLPHLVVLLDSLEDKEIRRKLVERHAILLERLSEDMKRYSLKHDAARRQLASHEENVAAKRGLLLLAGYRNVNFAFQADVLSREPNARCHYLRK